MSNVIIMKIKDGQGTKFFIVLITRQFDMKL